MALGRSTILGFLGTLLFCLQGRALAGHESKIPVPRPDEKVDNRLDLDAFVFEGIARDQYRKQFGVTRLGFGEIWVQDWVSAVGWPSMFVQSFIAYVIPETRQTLLGQELVAAYWLRFSDHPDDGTDQANPGVFLWLRNVGTALAPQWWPVNTYRLLVSGSPQELTALQAELATLYPELIFDLTAGSTLLVISEIQPIHFVPVVHQVEASSQTRGTVVGSLNDILVHQPNRMTPAHQITFKSGSCLAPWFSGTKQIEKDHPESCFKGALELPSGIRGKSRCAIDLPRCN